MTTMTRRQALTTLSYTAAIPWVASCGRNTPPSGETGSAESVSVLVDEPLHYLSLTKVAQQIENRSISPVELTESMLRRIAAVDDQLKSYATVMSDQAMAAAHVAEAEIQRGHYRGPLHGIPIAVKDLCFTQGVRTMGATAVLADFVPTYDATVVARLREAGAVLLGKLNLTEGAMAAYHPDFEIPVNPWDASIWPGASSSGSGVATAAGLCFGSLGSDTGGSIRFPSAHCGVVGLKPTWGRVSRYGVLELAGSLDHIGPMTRTVADAAIMLETIAGADPNDPTSLQTPVPSIIDTLDGNIAGLRLGFDRQYALTGVDQDVVNAVEEALSILEELGAEIVDVQVPDAPEDWVTICSFEAARAHSETYPSRADEYGPYFREFLKNGLAVTAGEYDEANTRRLAFVERFEEMLSTVDALVCPSTVTTLPITSGMRYESIAAFGEALASIAKALDPPLDSIQLGRFTQPADFAGTPTISVPCGFSDDGAPQSLQFVGRDLSEVTICRLAHAYEQATEWHTRHPEV